MQSLRRGSTPRDRGILAGKNTWFILVSSFLLLACMHWVLWYWWQIEVLIHEKKCFLDRLCSAVKTKILDYLHPPSALMGFLRGFSCNGCGMTQGISTHPWYPSDGWESPSREDPFPEWALCLETYLHRTSPLPAAPRCPLPGWDKLVLLFLQFLCLKYNCRQVF